MDDYLDKLICLIIDAWDFLWGRSDKPQGKSRGPPGVWE